MILEANDENIAYAMSLLTTDNLAKLIISQEDKKYILDLYTLHDIESGMPKVIQSRVKFNLASNMPKKVSALKVLATFRAKLWSDEVDSFSFRFDSTSKEGLETEYSYSYIGDVNPNIRFIPKVSKDKPYTPFEPLQITGEQAIARLRIVLGDYGMSKDSGVFKKTGTGRTKKQKKLSVGELLEIIEGEVTNSLPSEE